MTADVKHPSVSVVIPTYNHRDWVLESLGSVLAQTFADYEVILVNDGSPDDTASVVTGLVAKYGIRYIEQANAGQANARNRGISLASGKYIALLDDDDLWPPDKLAWQVEAMEAEPCAVMAYGDVQMIDAQGAATSNGQDPGPGAPSGQIRELLLRRNRIWSPGQTLMRTSTLKEIGMLDEAVWGADDWDLYIRLAGAGSVVYNNRLALKYRRHIGNASGNAVRMYFNQRKVFLKHMGIAPWRGRDIRREWRGASAGNCLPILEQALLLRAKRDFVGAWGACLLAVTIKPSLLKTRFFWRERFKPLITGQAAPG